MLAVLLVACSGTAAKPDGAPDAPAHQVDAPIVLDGAPDAPAPEADVAVVPDGGLDAVVPVPDAGAADAGSPSCEWDQLFEWARILNPALCTSAAAIEPPAVLTNQDTATGGHGECAVYASGPGGPNLYYSLTIPAGMVARVIAAPVTHTEDAVFRVLSDCGVTLAHEGARGGSTTDGRARGCVKNDQAVDRKVVIAVGRYSGEEKGLTLIFDLSVQIVADENACCCQP